MRPEEPRREEICRESGFAGASYAEVVFAIAPTVQMCRHKLVCLKTSMLS